MELRHLRYFDALAETLNFTRAAERLHVTQSTLSHQIRQLEDELGTPLFDRSSKQVRMTEAGEILRSQMTPALEQIDRGLQALRRPADSITGRIRLGTTPSFNTRMVPQCVATLLNHYPTIQVTVEELNASGITRGLTAGKLDLAVSYRPAEGSDGTLDLGVADDRAGDERDAFDQPGTMHVDPLEEIEAAVVSEPDVDEHRVHVLALQNGARLAGGAGGEHRVPATGEPRREGAADRLFVIDIEHGGHGATS